MSAFSQLSRLPKIVYSPFTVYHNRYNRGGIRLGSAKLALVGVGAKPYFERLYNWYLGTEKYVIRQQYKPLITALANRSITKNLVTDHENNTSGVNNQNKHKSKKDEHNDKSEDDMDVEYRRDLIMDVVKDVKINTVVHTDDEDVHTINKLHSHDYVTIAITESDASKHCIINAPRWRASDNNHDSEIATYIASALKPKFDSETSNYITHLKHQKLVNPNFNSDFWYINKSLVESLEYFNCSLYDYDRLRKMLWVTDLPYRELSRVRNQVEMMQMGVRIHLKG